MNRIDPLSDLGSGLLEVEKPSRYAGGEYGRLAKPSAALQTVAAFPDLYEIGMSNQALRILYNGLNRLDGVSCDRAFAPAPDFEDLLKRRGIPLYGLDTGIPLGEADMLLFTLGYELGITGVLAMLSAAGIPLRALDRTDYPIVIMGGPCVSNPLPYSRFIDAFWIGEAEGGFFELIQRAADMKRAGQDRAALRALLAEHPSVWVSGKPRVLRAVDTGFASRGPSAPVFPIPSMKVIQHHGAVEIMRGCPNGCRFCHAGYWYRPMRQKPAQTVLQEAQAFIVQGGYREISLSSLSTGDYRGIDSLVYALNAAYGKNHVSFQLPSLRVSSFSLPLLAEISEVRRSGLTFAVETPSNAGQIGLNKTVSRDAVTAILREARKYGWKGAKFYFMIGLPLGDAEEALEIADFIRDIAGRTGMRFNINVGTFVPKPHTPYQRAPQLDEAEAWRRLNYIRSSLKPLGHKVGIQDPFISAIEGVISRGDERTGELIEEAYAAGCRLDAWTEYIRKDLWRGLFEGSAPLVREILAGSPPDRTLPWDGIKTGVSSGYVDREALKSERREITPVCAEACDHPCGVCGGEANLAKNPEETPIPAAPRPVNPPRKPETETYRMLFAFTKKKSAVFQPHLAVAEVFSMAFLRGNIPVSYSQGFNPLPRLEIASPLSVGVEADAEIAAVDTAVFVSPEDFAAALNPCLPEGFRVVSASVFKIPPGVKKHSLSSLLWGYSYQSKSEPSADSVPAQEEKAYRLAKTGGSVYGLIRRAVLAKSLNDPSQPASYFTVCRDLYPPSPEVSGSRI